MALNQTFVDKIVDHIVMLVEKSGKLPWEVPWNITESPMSIHGRKYRGINVLMLTIARYANEWKSNVFLTYEQAKKLGGFVKKGEKSTPIVFWKKVETKVDEEEDDIDLIVESLYEKPRFFMRYYNVFNTDQCDLPAEVLEKLPQNKIGQIEFVPSQMAENVINQMVGKPNIIKHASDEAYYRPISDSIYLPEQNKFKKVDYYYHTFFHELIHSTGHDSRLNRDGVMRNPGFGTLKYSQEELIAEIGSTLLCSYCEIERKIDDNHVAYIQSWLSEIKEHKQELIYAAQSAQKAVDYILDHK